MRVATRLWVTACVVLLLGAWAGCSASGTAQDNTGGASGSSNASGSGGSAGSELAAGAPGQSDTECLRPLAPGEPYARSSQCEACPGLECTGTGETCSSGWHTLGSPWADTCQCVDGHMVCCGGSKGGAGTWYCDYGSQPRPACPAALPLSGDVCGEQPMYCQYPSSCCTSNAVAACRDGTWQLACDTSADSLIDPQCEGGAPGAAGAPGSTAGAGGARN
jgi:hypothetical protein